MTKASSIPKALHFYYYQGVHHTLYHGQGLSHSNLLLCRVVSFSRHVEIHSDRHILLFKKYQSLTYSFEEKSQQVELQTISNASSVVVIHLMHLA